MKFRWKKRDDCSPGDLRSPAAGDLEKAIISNIFGVDVDTVISCSTSVPAVKKIVTTATSLLARAPIRAFKNNRELAETQPWLLRRLERDRSRVGTIGRQINDLLLRGTSYNLISERIADSGEPFKIIHVPWSLVNINEYGEVISIDGQKVNKNTLFIIENPVPGLLEDSRGTLEFAQKLRKAALTNAKNPAPALILKQNPKNAYAFKEGEAQKIVETFVENVQRTGMAFLDKALDYESVGSIAENLLIAGRNDSAIDIARAMGFPAWAVDAAVSGTSLTYSNITMRTRELLDYSLGGIMTAIEEAYSDILNGVDYIKFDVRGIMRENFTSRISGYREAIEAGIMTIDEAKKREIEI